MVTQLAQKSKAQESLSMLTVPTSSMPRKKEEKLDNKKEEPKDFFGGLAEKLSGQQKTEGSDSKRTINF